MKTNILQIVLGLGIVLAMAFSIAWDPTGFYVRQYAGEPGNWNTVFNPDTKEVIATVLAYLGILSGAGITGISAALMVKKIRSGKLKTDSGIDKEVKKLLIVQTGLGLLATVGACLVNIWGFPTSYSFSVSDNLSHTMFLNPSLQFMLAMQLSFVAFLLGIISLTFSIARYPLNKPPKKQRK
jgi:hypothetical protein